MRTLKGPALFLAQFMGDEAPFDSLASIAPWVAECGYVGVQLPSNDARCMDLALAAESDTYCDELKGTLAEHGLVITELSTHIQGQMIAVHPAYRTLFDGFLPEALRGASDRERLDWARQQLLFAAKASRRLGLDASATFSGALLWHTVYPWPQRPAGLVEEGFAELARRWGPILDAYADVGVDLCYEIHPGEDLHDGVSFERFLEAVGNHPRASILYDPSHLYLQQIDYLGFLDLYHERIKMMHVKDAEFRPDARSGLYGGYQSWVDRPGRFRSLGDGQIDFGAIFSKLAQYDFAGWAVVEWECALKDSGVGAREGAAFVRRHIIPVTQHGFDDFVGGKARDDQRNRDILGI
ncbi:MULTISPECIES: sugar phosphate isomerase/epimerase family protein [unclassified Sphingomonas]|uniref:sugar phosphate isomerase/epimerase family protein n=1 Tax=unclassified Sphingomonas TaxID=196159 RepID=UPI0006FBCE20|nr:MULTISPECIES: sugar phosphate isomerase/epimerase [unclassified Sphingomonas]KQX25008.1 AP endonuclease [Sphingomonas sp. Root1294]KQY66025.1 AP endonuclease [Sphingomonas sp. Root50]KRB89810.1 AP endonuclease [Sphingomonas sp. Root720]